MTAVRPWDACTGDPCTCPTPPPSWFRYDVLLHARCGRTLADHPMPHAAEVSCPFPARPPVEFTEEPPVSRYYVSLTATCPPEHLHAVLDRMSAALPAISEGDQLDGLSLSFTREDGDELLTAGGSLPTALSADPTVPDTAWPERSELPPAGPVTSTGPGSSPTDAQPGAQR